MKDKEDRPFYEDYGYTKQEWIARQRDFEHANNLDYAMQSAWEREELGDWTLDAPEMLEIMGEKDESKTEDKRRKTRKNK